jgi:hypothetical protein
VADKTERAVQKIARKHNGDPKNADDIFELVLALADDTDEQHDEAVSEAKAARAAAEAAKTQVAAVAAKLDEHLVEAVDRDAAIADLARKYDEHLNVFTPPIVARLRRLEDASTSCPAVVQAAIEAEHAERHADHMATYHKPRREGDDASDDHTGERSNKRSGLVLQSLDRRVWVLWGIAVWLSVVIGGVLTYAGAEFIIHLFTKG